MLLKQLRSAPQHPRRAVERRIDAALRGELAIDSLPPLHQQPLAKDGNSYALAAWSAYRHPSRAHDDWLAQLIQIADFTFLRFSPSDNPEPWWFDELTLLHATFSWSCRQNDPLFRHKLDRIAQFHIEETQPDHATNEPWAIHAFLLQPHGEIVAGTMLHAAQALSTLTPAAVLLLDDAIAALEAGRARW